MTIEARPGTPLKRGGGRPSRRGGTVLATHRWILTPWLFLLPGLTVIVLMVMVPFANTLGLAFTDSTLLRQGQYVGWENFHRMFADERFTTALLNSTLYTVCVVPCMVVLPLILATLVSGAGRLSGFFRTTMYLPVVMSPVVVGLIWTNMLDKRGLVNALFDTLHLVTEPVPFLSDRWLLLFSAMFVTVWTGLGYYMVIYLAALANIDQSLYDAAAMDGAGVVRTFLNVTVPGVRSTMTLIAVLSSVAAFRVFGEIYVLTGGTGGVGGGDLTMTMLIQREGTGLQARTGYAGAISLFMFVVLGALLLVQLAVQRRQRSS
ncbi:MalF-type ABC sugar transport systems permease component [Streptomyces bingchenggensis BCW-1]|uniref:MalF-type ABC sugar transport systems permease component n=1 Tax=Streptomyces bingchenggensis (strain BCW-1) TaxID=749414 RepID=D7C4D0_STRBB|nr:MULTISPECIES: sugar ABC transporter permease [Streptomyces]ADI03952.1 MalF-type ABC sugar transport systems permease component [Streptomyces bingchenggensis BCW-1]